MDVHLVKFDISVSDEHSDLGDKYGVEVREHVYALLNILIQYVNVNRNALLYSSSKKESSSLPMMDLTIRSISSDSLGTSLYYLRLLLSKMQHNSSPLLAHPPCMRIAKLKYGRRLT
jgi:hypothetical protein